MLGHSLDSAGSCGFYEPLTPLASPDPICTTALGPTEAVAPPSSGCGVGPELALLVPALPAFRRRRGDRIAQA